MSGPAQTMTFRETTLPGVWLIEADVFADERGSFVRSWVRDEFEARGLETGLVQGAIATNRVRGTVRGLHYQAPPHEQAKLIQSVRGRVFDVAVDLRPDSPTFRQWAGVELTCENRRMLYLPVGVAHGYQTLSDDSEIFYFVSASYAPDDQRGIRWNDPSIGIEWPLGPPTVINERDASYPNLT